jgi:hypothetical protein
LYCFEVYPKNQVFRPPEGLLSGPESSIVVIIYTLFRLIGSGSFQEGVTASFDFHKDKSQIPILLERAF